MWTSREEDRLPNGVGRSVDLNVDDDVNVSNDNPFSCIFSLQKFLLGR
jgi:hypothetical protein